VPKGVVQIRRPKLVFFPLIAWGQEQSSLTQEARTSTSLVSLRALKQNFFLVEQAVHLH